MNINIFLKYPRLRIAASALGAIAFVWWCVFFPELCFPQDTYELVYETEEAAKEDVCGEACPELLEADDDQIVISSRVLEWMKKDKD